MRYSVWSYDRQVYDVFDTPETKATHAGSPSRAVFQSSLGATPEQASWTLPPNAMKVGESQLPQGRIATRGGALGGLGDIDAATGAKIGIVLGVAYFAYRSMKK